MKELWNKSSFGERVAILCGLGSDKEEAKKFARLFWNSLPIRLRDSLNNEYKNQGKPEKN